MSGVAMATVDEPEVQQVVPGGKRKLIVIAAAVALIALIGAGLWFSGILHHHAGNAGHGSAAAAAAEQPTLVDVPDVVTNLDSGSRRAVFIKLKARIEVAHASDQASINANMPRILDAFQTYLRSLSPEELHGGEGIYRLREALISRVNVIAGPVQILDVLFVEMLIQ